MNRADAISLLNQYATVTQDPKVRDLASRVVHHDEGKAFRWLGFVQGILVERGLYTVEEVKTHSRERRVPTLAEEMTQIGAPCPMCQDNTVVAVDCASKKMGWYQICLSTDCDFVKFEGSEDEAWAQSAAKEEAHESPRVP